MISEMLGFIVSLVLLLVSLISLVYWLFPGPDVTGDKKLEQRLEYFVFTFAASCALLVLLWMS